VGVAHILLMPFLVVFHFMHFFLKNAQEMHHSKSYLGPREWAPLAKRTFRELNELPHEFEARLRPSYKSADAYLRRFQSGPLVAIVARLFGFIAGAFVAVLLVFTLVDESILLHVDVFGRNLLWYFGIFSATALVARSVAGGGGSPADEEEQEDHETLMQRVADSTGHYPAEWRGHCHETAVRDELGALFRFRASLFAEEMACVLLAPAVLLVSLPRCAENVLRFIADATIDEGFGSMCELVADGELRRRGSNAGGVEAELLDEAGEDVYAAL